ncbi:MAG: family 1 glycosylhydrolase [Chitinivibrionales bacterium]|nr:family 1 glycosylhydrolase [Chitinivibrionales bacterium]
MYDIFSLPDLSFPDNFLWGSATAGHQIEGDNIHSQWWAEEREGKKEGPSGKACNHWELYKDDIELIGELGHRAYRMSIEWSRIEPQEGFWDEKATSRYLDILERLRKNSIAPFVTLHHFTHPLWFEKKGGFHNRDNIRYFERFVEYIVSKTAHLVESWNVFNEFNFSRHPHGGGLKINFLIAHSRGYHIIKRHCDKPVSTTVAFTNWVPLRKNNDIDRRMTDYVDFITNEFFFHAIRTGEIIYPHFDAEYVPGLKGSCDYWAVNYYSRTMVDSRKAKFQGDRFVHKKLNMIKRDFYMSEMYPEGLIDNIERLTDKPVYVTENGCSCTDDRWRIVALALHLCAIKEAIDRGVDVRGYFHWSTMDNYEWGSFEPRFGLVHVDFDTFKRTPKPSAWFYREIIEKDGVTQESIRRYLNELPTMRVQ